MTYKSICKQFLDNSGASIGDSITITNPDMTYNGILLDRSEDSPDGFIVLKMDSGYNIGVNIEDATLEVIKKGEKPKISYDNIELSKNDNDLDISIISTGGTVSSIIDYKTGAVHPAFAASDLLKANPELLDMANYEVKALYNILSENMKPEYWIEASKSIADEISSGSDGVVIAHGTDTMHYTSAALSFMIKSPVPIVLTGAQKSSDRPSTDAYLNLISSVEVAKSDISDVTVCMHETLNDDYCLVHKGTKVRKMHTSRRDTFRSINSNPIAKVKKNDLIIKNLNYTKRNENELKLVNDLETKVGYIKTFPGISNDFIEYHIDSGYKGILIEGTGLGHVPDYLVDSLKRANEENIPIIMSSQCLYGRVNMNVYSTGRQLIDSGVISCEDMTPETAYVKLCWVLGQTNELNEVNKLMKTNIAGEINDISSIETFLN
ncbi:Glu-tRNA(Gln) amidotransferase subunit GatD [Methanobrevibacter sp. DSM 116169]|uniref:Glu-tRNA(Gln) amidotransferase subunit GatD n=1 Tax=Methanobrevibacter sp. DSM 116169 TaxID=3242727 RepID=UPI0038FD3A2A